MKVLGINHIPASSHVEHGITKSKFPEFARTHRIISGGNGSYRVLDPAQTTLAYKNDDGNTMHMEFNKETKEILGKDKIYQTTLDKLNSKIFGLTFTTLNKDDLKSQFQKAYEFEQKKNKERQKMMTDSLLISKTLTK